MATDVGVTPVVAYETAADGPQVEVIVGDETVWLSLDQIAYYNLDAILAVGYRISSGRGVQFRTWATRTLGQERGNTLESILLTIEQT